MSVKLLGKAQHIKNIIGDLNLEKSKHELIQDIQERLSNSFIFDFLPGFTTSDKLDGLIGEVCTNTITKTRGESKKRSYAQLQLYFAILKDILVSMGELEEWESVPAEVNEAFSDYIKNKFVPVKELHIGKITIKERASVADASSHSTHEFTEILNNIMDYFLNDYVEHPENYVRELNFRINLKDL